MVHASRYAATYPFSSVAHGYSDTERVNFASLCDQNATLYSQVSSTAQSLALADGSPIHRNTMQTTRGYLRNFELGFSQATLHTTLCEALLTLSTVLLWKRDLPLASLPALTRNTSLQGSASFVCGQLFPQLFGGWSELEGGLVEGGDEMTRTMMRNALGSCRKQIDRAAGSGVSEGGLLVLFVFVKAIFAYLYIRPDTTIVPASHASLHHRPNHSPLPPTSDPTSADTEYTRSHDLLIYSIIIHSTFNLIVFSERAKELMGIFSKERVLMGAEALIVLLVVGTVWSEWRERVERRKAEKKGADLEDCESSDGVREKK